MPLRISTGAFATEIDASTLTSVSVVRAGDLARRADARESLGDRWPAISSWRRRGARAMPAIPRLRGELQVRVAIADHVAARRDRWMAGERNRFKQAESSACGTRSRRCAKCGQMNIGIEPIPCERSSSSRKSCGTRKSASGNAGVPSPSWLLTSTSRNPASLQRQAAPG